MDVLHERCAGLDVHKKQLTACVRFPGRGGERRTEIRTFATTTRGLLELRDWLSSYGVTVVGMEATGVYWRSPYYLLEEEFTCQLYNARHMHNVPGRKTDVKDAEWICQLTEHGLVRPSFVPPKPIRDLRVLTRHRAALVKERNRMAQRLEKALQDAGIKLSSVTRSTLGVSGREMLGALIEGERDPKVLASFARGRMREKLPELTEALEGRFSRVHAVVVAECLAHIDFLDEQIGRLEAQVEEAIAPFAWAVALLETIPGVGPATAWVIVAECGVDMSRFPSAAHLASWAGMCPGNYESAGRRRSGRTRKGNRWLREALRQAARSATRSKGTYYAAQYHRLVPRLGKKRAIMAVAHSMLVAAWHMLSERTPHAELGADYFTRHDEAARTRRLVRQLERLGHRVALEPLGETA